ncbi:MAG: hypothetical protein LBD30_04290, partial [Verrucomicrobiales bacterium]|nr:hypothetical protein [Verrucomicrobiales bacterium]
RRRVWALPFNAENPLTLSVRAARDLMICLFIMKCFFGLWVCRRGLIGTLKYPAASTPLRKGN